MYIKKHLFHVFDYIDASERVLCTQAIRISTVMTFGFTIPIMLSGGGKK